MFAIAGRVIKPTYVIGTLHLICHREPT